MKKTYLVTLLLIGISYFSKAQYTYYQYFDGADTSSFNSILIKLDTSRTNIWQIGRPQKPIFDSAYSLPNDIVTDTIHNIPPNNTSRFSLKLLPWNTYGILVLQWVQKLDMQFGHQGGYVEFSVDTGKTWQNAFNNPHVFNFYGFQPANEDTVSAGNYAFSGTDSTWRDIWFCLDMSWLSSSRDSVIFRFTLQTDTGIYSKEGWEIDNMMARQDIAHPVHEVHDKDYVDLYPNPTAGQVNVSIQNINDFHIIEHMELEDAQGRTVQTWKNVPTQFWFDTSTYPNGVYFLNVTTNIKSERVLLVVKH
ncbi:MAG TPA: T9SS type A sorting domain-containing protein [Bacteroidia bacterium]|jgi:hypothetical protein|nr:T9SS type A sorting domain-containing protein [Bacteroidia bacterium]